jgi:hypothetical protein
MTAAIRAADLGLTVEVVEASPLIGGVAAVSGGFVWVGNNSLSKEAGLGDSWQAVDTYLDGLAGGLETDRPLRDAITRAASRMLDYLRDRAGIEMHVCERQDMHHPQMPGSASSGRTVEFVEHGHRIDRKTRALLRPSYHFRDGLMQHEIYRAGGKVSAYRKLGGLLEQRRNSDVLTMGPGLVGALARAAFTDRGVDYRVETALTDLSLFPDGSVEAHLVDGEGRTERRRAGAVLLAIGSYGHHADAAAIEGLPTLTEQSPRILRGDLFRLSEQVGAGLVRRGRLYLSLGFRNENPQSQDEPEVIQVYDTLGLPHTILVNRDGRRFADENAYPAVMEGTLQFDSTSNRHRNIPAYFIADRRFREKGGFPSLEEWPEKSMVEAASLEELAGMLGIDASGFVAEVADFNRSCAAGEQPVFGRGATAFGRLNNSNRTQGNGSEAFLAPLDEPPFYGVEVLPAAAGIYPLGFRVEPETARVLRQDGQTVPAIYAAGNLVAYGDLPGAYEGGYANARGMALAFLAAEDVARRLGQQGG